MSWLTPRIVVVAALGCSAFACGSTGDSDAVAGPSSTSTTVEVMSATSPAQESTSSTSPAPAAPATADTTPTDAPAALAADGVVDTEAVDESPGRQLDAVDAALSDQDLCGVYDGLAEYDVSATSTSVLRDQVSRILDVMQRARTLVPSEIAADWSTVTKGTSVMLESLVSGDGSAPAGFDGEGYENASHRVGEWMESHCG